MSVQTHVLQTSCVGCRDSSAKQLPTLGIATYTTVTSVQRDNDGATAADAAIGPPAVVEVLK
jgi:hypothetical protein